MLGAPNWYRLNLSPGAPLVPVLAPVGACQLALAGRRLMVAGVALAARLLLLIFQFRSLACRRRRSLPLGADKQIVLSCPLDVDGLRCGAGVFSSRCRTHRTNTLTLARLSSIRRHVRQRYQLERDQPTEWRRQLVALAGGRPPAGPGAHASPRRAGEPPRPLDRRACGATWPLAAAARSRAGSVRPSRHEPPPVQAYPAAARPAGPLEPPAGPVRANIWPLVRTSSDAGGVCLLASAAN